MKPETENDIKELQAELQQLEEKKEGDLSNNKIEESKQGPKQRVNKAKKEVDDDILMDGGDGEMDQQSTYSKFKTQNEIEIDRAFETGPEMIKLDGLDEIVEFGRIRQFISQGVGMVLIEPSDPLKLFDIENMVCFGDKQVIGFVFELVGPITNPLYSIQLYPEYADKLTAELAGEQSPSPEQLTELLK